MLMAVTSVSAQHGVSIDMGESYLENNTHMTHEVVGLNSMTNTLKGKHANVLKNDTTLSRRERMRSRIDSVLTTRYYNTPYDTNYVVRPEGTLTLKLRWNHTGNTFHAKGTVNDVYAKANVSTHHKNTLSIAAIYRGIGVGIAINPAKWKGIYKDYEFNLNYYSNRFSIDFSYQRSESLTGDIHRNDVLSQLQSGDVTLKVTNVAGYYTFNHRCFSFPAAFTQSYIQRQSAGSWLLGVSYQGGSIKTNDELKMRNPNAPEIGINIGHIGLGGGYGYNWVFGKKWLLHFSLLPTVVLYNRNKLTVNGDIKKAKHMRFNMVFNERVAIVRNFSPRFFFGATLVMSNSIFDDDVVIVNQNKWRTRVFFGLRL